MNEREQIPPSVTIKAGHVQPLWAGHPWVFKQAIDKVDKGLSSGDEVLVIDPQGKVLGRGLYSPSSAIAVRLFTSQGAQSVDGALLLQKITQAIALRQAHQLPDETQGRETSGYRLIHGEGDGLPGLIVDVFGDVVVAQLGTAGLQRLREEVAEALTEALGERPIIDRTPKSAAQAEGFYVEPGVRMLRGEAPTSLNFSERGLKFELPIELSQKTGFYFDQRPLRARIEALSAGRKVLDTCCYVGPFALSAARGGATEVLAVDRSEPAIATAKKCAELNGFADKIVFEVEDATKALQKAAADGGYDLVICDPPKLATKRRHRNNAFGGYRKLAASACAAVKPGGVLALCSCSAAVSQEQLSRALALGARDAGRRAIITERYFQGPDHPVVAAFSEGLYLKVLLARIEAV